MTWWAQLFRLIPANFLSFWTGFFVRLKFPGPIQRLYNRGFVRAFGIDMSEAEFPLEHYSSIEAVFTRRLRVGARRIQGNFVSPSDGIVSYSLPSSGNNGLLVKGSEYCLSELATGASDPNFGAAWYSTVYLAPHNYHRVHFPFSCRLLTIRHIPGFLWSVNSAFVSCVPRLFNQNERLVFEVKTPRGGRGFIVMVGAFNVGRMTTPFWKDYATNALCRSGRPSIKDLNPGVISKIGDELGTFELGSTVVVILDSVAADELRPQRIEGPRPIQVGQSLSGVL